MKNQSPNSKAWNKFMHNAVAFASLGIISIFCFVAFFAYLLAPDHTPNANEQFTILAAKSPGFKQEMLLLKKDSISDTNIFQKIISGYDRKFIYVPINAVKDLGNEIEVSEFRGDGMPNFEYVVNKNNLLYAELSENIVSKTFYLGTDQLGRDILSRLLVGSRVSLLVGFFAVIISTFIGIIAGGFAGYYRSWVDSIILWKMSVFWSIPTILLSMALFVSLKSFFSNNLWLIFIAIGLTMWVSMARMVRGQMLAYREFQFVEAAGSLGFSNSRIIFRHIMPNLLGPIVVVMASNFANAILVESGLSFLGLGVQAPAPSWGGMLNEFKDFIGTHLSYLAIIPGFLIMILVLCFNLVGNGIRDALDIKN